MESLGPVGRVMPLYASLPITAIFLVLIGIAIRRQNIRSMRFLLFAIGFRYLLSAFHIYTFKASPIGLSWNALGTIAAAGIGLLVVRKRRLFDPAIVAIAPLLAMVTISGLANGQFSAMISVLAKYTYFLVLVLALVDALDTRDVDKVLRPLLLPLSIPFVFQFVGIPLGIVKASEADGSASYVGGFSHEANFSICLATGLLALCFIKSMRGPLKAFLIVVSVAAVGLANYRTTIVAVLPLLAVTVMTGVTRRFIPRQQPLILSFMLIAVAAVGAFGAIEGEDRFADVAILVEKGTDIIKPPGDFTMEDRKLMSGRAMIWSRYIYAYRDGTPLQHWIGFGAESWQRVFTLYAHNTFVSTLYELGTLGIGAMLFLLISMFIMALRTKTENRPRIIAAHVGFFLLAMATMPLWSVEGLIFYGLLCGYTVSEALRARAGRTDVARSSNREAPPFAGMPQPARVGVEG